MENNGPVINLFSRSQSFKKLISPSKTVTNFSPPPNSKLSNSSISEKYFGENMKTRLKKVERAEKRINRILNEKRII